LFVAPWPDDQPDDIISTDLPLDDDVARLAYMDDIERFRRDYLQDYLRERALSDGELDTLISTRDSARKNRNWAEADRIRDELAAMGIVLKDNKDGTTTWEPKQ
jgi:cysteinyl-tRNA synthetase